MYKVTIERVPFAETKAVIRLKKYLQSKQGKRVTPWLWVAARIYKLTLKLDRKFQYRLDVLWWNKVMENSKRVWRVLEEMRIRDEQRNALRVPENKPRPGLSIEERAALPGLLASYHKETDIPHTIKPMNELFAPFKDAAAEGKVLGVDIPTGELVEWPRPNIKKRRTRKKKVTE